VLLQSFEDEFELSGLPKLIPRVPRTPAEPGSVLIVTDEDKSESEEMMSKYRTGVGKLLHMMRWSRPGTLNAVRELSRFLQKCTVESYEAMLRTMRYCVGTPERGLFLNPNKFWDGSKDFVFEITGKADTEYAKDPLTRRTVGGRVVYLNGSPISFTSKMQRIVALSVTESEYIEATECAQDMLFAMRVMNEMQLKVKLPMVLEVDNQGAVDIANNWSSTGRTRHMDVRLKFLRELKEADILHVTWISGDFV
jgi:hypothetical protein